MLSLSALADSSAEIPRLSHIHLVSLYVTFVFLVAGIVIIVYYTLDWLRQGSKTLVVVAYSVLALLAAFVVFVLVGLVFDEPKLGPKPVPTNVVSKFDARTGALIDAAFIRNLRWPFGIKMFGINLYIACGEGNSVRGYECRNGRPRPIIAIERGLLSPTDLIATDTTMFVNNHGPGQISTYSIQTGACLNPTLIRGLINTTGMALIDGKLYLANLWEGTVCTYFASSGQPDRLPFITGLDRPHGLAYSNGGIFLIQRRNIVSKYDAETGAIVNPEFIRGLQRPFAMAISNGLVYLTDADAGTIGKYDLASGKAVNARFIEGLQEPLGIVVSGDDLYVTCRHE